MEKNMNEVEFNQVPDFPDYYVSKDGRVRSLKKGKFKDMTIHQNPASHHLVVAVYQNHKFTSQYVARLVLSTYVGYPAEPELCIAYFKDGDKTNCSLDNLEWLICETTPEYDPTKSKRKGILRPGEVKEKMSIAKYNQSPDTIQKIVTSRIETMRKKRTEKAIIFSELQHEFANVFTEDMTEKDRKRIIDERIEAVRKKYV